MIIISKRIVKLFIFLGIFLFGLKGNAQVGIFQNTINKLERFKNFSFQYIYKQKEGFGDTLINNQKFIFLKSPNDREVGYFFKHEFRYADMKVPTIELYNGKNQISLYPKDSTYQASNRQAITFNQSLLGQLIWLKTFLMKNPSKLLRSGDTTVNSIDSYHLVMNIRDTVINKDHIYVRRHLFIDKLTELPVRILNQVRTADFSKEVANYFTEETYFNYQIEQDSINIDYFAKLDGIYKVKANPEKKPLLVPGTRAPEWTLYDSENNKTSLSQFRGKIVLLDFFFVGCVPCIQSLASLDNIQKKYKNKGFVVLSISTRDRKNLVKEFKVSQNIKNKIFPNGGKVADLYHVQAAPTFYLIDRSGKISSVVEGYSDEFEQKMAGFLDALIKRE